MNPMEQQALTLQLSVEHLVVDTTYAVSRGDTLRDGQMKHVQDSVAKLWGTRSRDVVISHHGVPVLAPDVDLLSLPRHLRYRPEVLMHPGDRARRQGETLADYAERLSILMMLSGALVKDEAGALKVLYSPRELDPLDDEVWDRLVGRDPEVLATLLDEPAAQRFGRDVHAAVVAASGIDSRDFVGPVVKSWLSQITEDITDAVNAVTTEPSHMLEALRDCRRQLGDARDSGVGVVEAEARARSLCDQVAQRYPALCEAYLTLAVPLSRAAHTTAEQAAPEIADGMQYLLSQIRSRLDDTRGDVSAMVEVLGVALQDLKLRVDGMYQGEGPRYPKLPLNLIREYCTELNATRFARRAPTVVRRPEGVPFPLD